MKKIFSLMAVACLLIVLFSSCDPEPIPPGPPPVTFSLSTIVGGKGLSTPDKLSGITLGSAVALKFTPEPGYSLYSVKINGVKVEEIQPSSTEVSYVIQNVNKNMLVEVVFVETNILLLSVPSVNEKPWMLKKIEVYNKETNLRLRDMYLSPQEKSEKYYFLYPSMDIIVYDAYGGTRSGKWSLFGTNLKIGSANLILTELTQYIFSNTDSPYWSEYDKCMVYPKFIYERN